MVLVLSEAHPLAAQSKVKVRLGVVYRELQPASSEVGLAIGWRKNSESRYCKLS